MRGAKPCARIDEIVYDEAFYIPFWTAPFVRLVYVGLCAAGREF
jgi:hypothetical protein